MINKMKLMNAIEEKFGGCSLGASLRKASKEASSIEEGIALYAELEGIGQEKKLSYADAMGEYSSLLNRAIEYSKARAELDECRVGEFMLEAGMSSDKDTKSEFDAYTELIRKAKAEAEAVKAEYGLNTDSFPNFPWC